MKILNYTHICLFRLCLISFSGSIANTRRDELAIQAIKNKEAAELKAAQKAAEEAGKNNYLEAEF